MDFNRTRELRPSLNFNISRLKGSSQRVPIADVDPEVAAKFLTSSPDWQVRGEVRLRFWGGSWWWWRGGRYTLLSNDHVEALVLSKLKEQYTGIQSTHIRNIITHLRSLLIIGPIKDSDLDRNYDQPCWLSNRDWDPRECMTTENSIIHLPSLVGGVEPASIPASPEYFSSIATRCKFNPAAPVAREWLSFLQQLWPNDPESIEALQLWFGYCLTPDTSQQKMLLMVGPKRGGKGTIARILSSVIGEGNVAAPTYASFNDGFALECLLGKTLAIIGDVRISGRSDRSPFVERLLTISGGDHVTVNRKYKSPFSTKLPTRFMLLTNESPRLDDASATIISRMIVLRLTKSFYGDEDTGLEQKLMAELPGILNWSIEGWAKLHVLGRMKQPKSADDLIEEMNALASPLTAFIDECCTIGKDETIECGELFRKWREWCELQSYGDAVAGSMVKFGRDLRSIVPELERKRGAGDRAGDRPWEYRGIGWRTAF